MVFLTEITKYGQSVTNLRIVKVSAVMFSWHHVVATLFNGVGIIINVVLVLVVLIIAFVIVLVIKMNKDEKELESD